MAFRIPMLRAPTLRIALPSIAHDPGSASLRRGLRAAVVVPLLLGAAMLLAVQQSVATFLVFGAMALLVFAGSGGKTRSRVSAYILAALAGVPLIAVGTLASASVWIAVGASALVGFVLSGLGVFGGYFLSAQAALMLAFILSVTSVAPIEATAPRVVGWMVAGGVAVLAGWLVWPRSSHVALRGLAASVIRDVAETIATPRQARSSSVRLATNWRRCGAASSSPSADHLVQLAATGRLQSWRPSSIARAPSPRPPHPPVPQPQRTKPADSDRPSYTRCRRVLHCWKAAPTRTTSSRWSQPATRTVRRSTAGWPNNSRPA